ncbi:site-specific DNA-methyltransferase [Clostridium botulinum]|nr:DNA methylase family protein [Clostridium botulinum 202F]KAI3346963.1 site-specific DNA-methyltransferase [Clostridium botulinum]MBY6987246.1 site-specific DNA-methyltransferase [Clostridium botulinum]NFG99684.1 site-specific DNA-methyltransferase [Clostridium botulinum]NFH89133.1 site-specific DNA-methyltransferase [Clostridium botulinum]
MLRSTERLHPTQKPVEIYEYIIKTFTNEKSIVMDIAAGSCTLLEAALNTDRYYICIEKEKQYFNKGVLREENYKKSGQQLQII